MTQKLVSVIIPTYNHAHFLTQALQSLQAQTYPDWEAVLVNNFSTDNTEEVVAGFSDPRIRLENFANQGVIAASRNHGLKFARGEYVAFLDSDDFWESDKLEQCVRKLESEGLDWVCHAERWWGDGVDKEVSYGPASAATFDALLYRGNCISTSAVVAKKFWIEQVGAFSEAPELITAEDYHLWLKLAQAGARVGFLTKILGTYRLHPGNQSRSVLKNTAATAAVVAQFFSANPDTGWRERWRRRVRRGGIAYSGARGLQNTHQHAAAWPWFLRALWYSPLDKRILPAMLMNALRLRF